MTFFQFQHPIFFALLLLLPILAWWAGRMGPEAAVRFSSTALARAVSRERRSQPGKLLFALRLLALAAIIIALARPQLGRINESIEAEGIDIVIALDLSFSMRALDLSTEDDIVTRLDVARRAVDNFIDQRPHDRIGLIAFAPEVYVVSPLTLNHDWLKRNLQRLDLGEIDGRGTAIGTALGASVNRLRDHPDRSRVVILLTDGENNAGTLSPLGAAEAAQAHGVRVYTIATGSSGRVALPEMDQNGRVIRDSAGRPVNRGRSEISGFDDSDLRQIAEMTGGEFFSATAAGELEQIYQRIDEMERTEIELRSYASFTELFIWPTLLGLALLGLEQLLRNTRYHRLP